MLPRIEQDISAHLAGQIHPGSFLLWRDEGSSLKWLCKVDTFVRRHGCPTWHFPLRSGCVKHGTEIA